MTHVDLESALVPEPRDDVSDELRRDRFDRVAAAADQMDVRLLGRRVVGRSAVIEMGMGDETELLEELEVAVDGRDVDRMSSGTDFDADVFRGRVTEPRDRFQDELALRGQPIATLAQLGLPVGGRSACATCGA